MLKNIVNFYSLPIEKMTTELSMQPLETTKNWYAQFVQFSQEIMKEKMDY